MHCMLLLIISFSFVNQVHLGDTPHDLKESDLEFLGRKTEGFSGSDIAVCVSVYQYPGSYFLTILDLVSVFSYTLFCLFFFSLLNSKFFFVTFFIA